MLDEMIVASILLASVLGTVYDTGDELEWPGALTASAVPPARRACRGGSTRSRGVGELRRHGAGQRLGKGRALRRLKITGHKTLSEFRRYDLGDVDALGSRLTAARAESEQRAKERARFKKGRA